MLINILNTTFHLLFWYLCLDGLCIMLITFRSDYEAQLKPYIDIFNNSKFIVGFTLFIIAFFSLPLTIRDSIRKIIDDNK